MEGCPYLKDDHEGCPAKEKCPYYQKMKTGKLGEVDLTKNDCPLAEKCPYYKDFKKNPSKLKDCPVHGCPHFEGHHEHGIKHDDVAKCPHFVTLSLSLIINTNLIRLPNTSHQWKDAHTSRTTTRDVQLKKSVRIIRR